MLNEDLAEAARRCLIIKHYDVKGVSDTVEVALQSVLDETSWTPMMERIRAQMFPATADAQEEKYVNALRFVLSDEGEPNMRDAVKGLLKPYLGKRPAAAGAGADDDEKEAASPRAGDKRKRAG